MASLLKLKKSSVSGKVPTAADLEYGELAINYADGVLYYKDSTNNINSIGVQGIVGSQGITGAQGIQGAGAGLAVTEYINYTYTADGNTTTYAATSGVNVNNVLVTLNGILQRPTVDYTISGSNIVLDVAPASGVVVQIRVLGGLIGPQGVAGSGSQGTAGTLMQTSLINSSNTISNTITGVTALRFDSDSGFDLTDLGNGAVKVGMNSTFKTWQVDGQTDLVATGLDTIKFIAGTGIQITTNSSTNPKSITFTNSISQAQSAQGVQGVQGISGYIGADGSQGTTGSQGIQGTIGSQGIEGSQGTTGSQGIEGSQGTSGSQGIQGTTGSQGIQGTIGSQGIQGSQGTTGSQGIEGSQGTSGSQGIQGTTGSQGIQGTTGSQGIEGSQGTTGSQGIQGTTGSQGIEGSQGTSGSQGIQGTTGSQGIEGSQGTSGSQGIQGTTGNQGIEGSQGTTGSQGIQGTTGSQGIQGITGSQGIEGSQGTSGSQGIQGTTGSQGIQGTTGIQGIQGSGTQGTSGSQGIQGTGIQGTTGSQGIQGITGSQGVQGSGTQGTDGIQGIQGPAGPSGGGGAGTSNYGGVGYLTYNYVGNGSTTTFATNSEISEVNVDNILVTENGILQVPTTDYTVTNTNVIFTTAPATGTNIQIRILGLRGLQGTTGLQGRQGIQGVQGLHGQFAGQGVQGNQGTQGLSSQLERHYHIPGTIGISTGTNRWWIQSNSLITQLRAQVTTAPTGTSIIININKNGSQTAQLTIAATTNSTESIVNISATKDDYFTVDVIQKGSIIAGIDLVISFLYRRI